MAEELTDELQGALSHLGGHAAAAWQESFLRLLPQPAIAALAASALEIEAEQGQLVRPGELAAPPRPTLVVSGLVRVFASSPQGREVTIRYTRRGAVIGLSSALAGGARNGIQAVTKSKLLVLQSVSLRQIAMSDADVAWVLCQQLCETVLEITDHLSTNVFQSVIERVAATLLALDSESQDETPGIQVNQQQLADAVGSVREVVARALRQLRDAGLIERSGSRLILSDRAALERLASFGNG